jgi:tRNA (cmo5U34)-methyltransferase
MMTDTRNEWTEEDSMRYRELATVAVPARDEQIATLLALLPFAPQGAFRAVEVGCGEGVQTLALLDSFPHASVTALDGSPSMVTHATRLLSRFGPRVSVMPFSLTEQGWLSQLDTADCVVSSLCLHHLSAEEKRRLFAEVYDRLSARGALLIADVVEPQRAEARALFAAVWDRMAEAQARAKTGEPHLFEKFVEGRWNYYRFPDPVDHPSPLFAQLQWLREAGFAVVDCFWLQAGHAIYGGYKARTSAPSQNVPFAAALRAAQRALRVTSQAT